MGLTPLLVRLQRAERLLDQFPPHFLFFFRRHLGVADDVDDAVAEHGAVGADHLGDGQRRGDLHRGDAGFL